MKARVSKYLIYYGPKRKGAVLLLVLYILVPLLFICSSMIAIVATEYMTNSNMITKQQACYNAEAGIIDAKGRIKTLHFDKNRRVSYYVLFPEGGLVNAEMPEHCKDAVSITIEERLKEIPPNYIITTTGVYEDSIARLQQKYCITP